MKLTIEVDDNLLDAISKRIIEMQSEIKINPDKKYTVRDIAHMTKKSPQTIRGHIASGQLEAELTGKYYLITSKQLQAYVNNQ